MRTSTNQVAENILVNGYDYTNQAWVRNGRYLDCNHPKMGEITTIGDIFEGCNCYGRANAGEICTAIGNGNA